MTIEFITLIETNPTDPEWPRSSSLAICDRYPDGLRVVGDLPHGYEWRPKKGRDRDRLVAWLQDIDYKGNRRKDK